VIGVPHSLEVIVECYAGYRGEQTPRRFQLHERTFEIDRVIDQWLAPDHRYFKVRTADGDVCILRHDGTAERWELTMFERNASH
jgi:hypothetical protein